MSLQIWGKYRTAIGPSALLTLALALLSPPAQALDLVPSAQMWSEVDVSARLSRQWTAQVDVQYSRQGDNGGTNFLSYNQQLAVRPWLHFYVRPWLRLSTFAGLWDNFAIAEVGNRAYPEFRTALQASVYQYLSASTIAHRLRIENRMIRDKQFSYEDVARLRYQLKYVKPIARSEITKGTNYFVGFDEIFINGGSQVTGHNLFDQNRAFVGIGRALGDDVLMEIGYFNQVQLEANGTKLDVNHILQLSLMWTDVFAGRRLADSQ